MVDEKSFSDWESVTDDALGYNNSEEEKNKKQAATNKVVVELSPEGMKSSQQSIQVVPNPHSQTSSVASSFVRDIGALHIKKKSDDASSLSSFVPVARIERNADFPAADEEPSWSQVSSQHPTQLSFAASGWMSADSSTVGSMAGNFDFISLFSGQTIMRCKRCKFHNPSQTTICNSCDLALTANPCMVVDQQIAMALQEKEEREVRSLLVDQEQKRGQLKDESLFSRSTFLAHEILTYVKKIPQKGFHTFLEYDMKLLAAEFIKAAAACGHDSRVSLAYKFTSSNQDTWNAVRSRGFATHKGVVKVSQNIAAALTSYHMERGSLPNLTSIPEEHDDESDTTPSRVTGWIVALVESPYRACAVEKGILLSSGSAYIKRVKRAEQVLPLVCFDARLKDSDGIRRLVNGLSRICRDFFGSGLDSETIAMPPPPPQKKPRPSEETPSGRSDNSNPAASKKRKEEDDRKIKDSDEDIFDASFKATFLALNKNRCATDRDGFMDEFTDVESSELKSVRENGC